MKCGSVLLPDGVPPLFHVTKVQFMSILATSRLKNRGRTTSRVANTVRARLCFEATKAVMTFGMRDIPASKAQLYNRTKDLYKFVTRLHICVTPKSHRGVGKGRKEKGRIPWRSAVGCQLLWRAGWRPWLLGFPVCEMKRYSKIRPILGASQSASQSEQQWGHRLPLCCCGEIADRRLAKL